MIRIVAVCAGLFSVAGYGNTLNWSGAGANANWNNSANWGGGTPGNGDTLIFPGGAAKLLNTNNIANLTLNQIRFAGASGGFDLRGNAFTLTNSIMATNTSGANTIENNITLATANVLIVVSNGVSLTLGGTNSGSVGVNKAGLGTLTYQSPGDNTYLGTTLVSGGTLQLNVNGFHAFGGPLVIGDGTGTGSPTVQNLQNEEISETAPITINLNGTLNLNNFSETIGPSLTFSNGTILTGIGMLTLSLNSTITITNGSTGVFSGNLNTGSGTLNLRGNGYLDLFAVVSGSANIVQNDSVNTYWNGANTYTGNYTANGSGYIDLNNSLALGNINNTMTLNGQTWIAIYGNINITNQSLTINSTSGNALYVFGASTNSWRANFTLGSACSVDVFTNCALTLNGPIGGSGGFTKLWPGTLTLSGSSGNTYGGLTTVNEGELDLNKTSGSAIPAFGPGLVIGDGIGTDTVRCLNNHQFWSIVTPVTINIFGVLDLNGNTDEAAPLSLNGGSITTGSTGHFGLYGTVTVLSAATATISGNVFLDSGVVINNYPGAYMFISASISGSYGITLAGAAGSVFLQSSNSYTGLTIVQQGWLHVENCWALGSTNAGTVVSSGASLQLASDIGITNESLTLNGPGVNTRWGALDVESGNNTWAGPITLNADSTLDSWYAGSALRIAGPISGSGGLALFGSGTHYFEGSTANTYLGVATVAAGTTLVLNKTVYDGAIPHNLDIFGTVRLAAYNQIIDSADVLVESTGLLDFGSSADEFDTLRGNGSVTFGTGGYLFIGVNNGSSIFDGVMSGIGFVGGYTVGKDGAGTFTMNGNNTYQNRSDVYGGTLIINGSQPQSPVRVYSGGTLGGSGTVGDIVAAGTVSPGASPGTLTCSNLTFIYSGTPGEYSVELTGPTPGTGYDQLNVRGTNILANATLNLNLAFTTPVALGQQFTIINNDGTDPITGIFLGYPEGATFLQNGFAVSISYVGGTGNDVVLTLTSIPGAVAVSTVTSGNGNAAIDPNECDALRLGITNTSGLAMTGVSATLSSADPNVMVTQPASTYADVPSGGMSTNVTPFQITVLPSFLCGNNINLILTVTSASHGAFTLPVVLKSGETASSPSRYDNNNTFSIPDIGSIESTNIVAGFSGPVMKVAVSLYITHTRDQDLTNISLIGPDGTTVMLSAANGGSGQNYGSATNDASRTTFDDAAATAITSGTAPFVGTFRPQSPLSAFNGSTSVNGNWRLHLADGYSGSVGTLRAWSLFLYPLTCGSGGGACALCADGTLYNNTLDASGAVQIGRLVRNCVISTCGFVKPCPGVIDSVPRYYHAYPFYNGQSNTCITVALTNPPCNLMSVAYLGSFDPVNPCANYLGDAGNDTGNGQGCGLSGALTYSFTVPSNSVFVVTVNEVGYGLCGNPYTLSVSGGDCRPILNIVPASSSKVDLNWPTVAGGYNLEATPSLSVTNWTGVTNEPIAISNRFNVTNSSVSPTNRFYRLHKP